jgi:hypothetical protein
MLVRNDLGDAQKGQFLTASAEEAKKPKMGTWLPEFKETVQFLSVNSMQHLYMLKQACHHHTLSSAPSPRPVTNTR